MTRFLHLLNAAPGASTLGRQLLGGRRSLVDELTAAEEGEDLTDDSSSFASSVRWGGTAGTTGIDMEEQEAILTRYFRPDQVKKLMKEQQEVDENYSVLRVSVFGAGQCCCLKQHAADMPYMCGAYVVVGLAEVIVENCSV